MTNDLIREFANGLFDVNLDLIGSVRIEEKLTQLELIFQFGFPQHSIIIITLYLDASCFGDIFSGVDSIRTI